MMSTLHIRKKKDFKQKEEKIPLKLSIDTLNIILAYVIKESDTINRGCLMNVRRLFGIIDQRVYQNDYQLIARFKFIQRALDAKLDDYIENPTVILESCRSKKYADVEDEIIEDVCDLNLKANDIKYVTNMINDKLSCAFLFKYKDPLNELLLRLENGEYESFKKIKKSFKREITGLLTEIRKVENLELSDSVFSLTDELFDASVSKTVKKLQATKNTLKTTIRYLNDMLNGGFEASRIYTFLGLSGGFKSGTLLNMAYAIRMANTYYKTKDPLKRPALLYITQENSVEESVDRLFSLCVADNTKDMLKNYTPKEAIKLLKTKGRMKLTKEHNIDIIIEYKAPGSITAADISAEIETLEEEGTEVICLIHDYLKKLKSIQLASDQRIELGYCVDDLKALAVEKEIPVITATQLNREAVKTVDAAAECNKTDLARMLGIGNVADSWSIIENSDWVAIVNRERQLREDKLYLTFKRMKIRYGTDKSIDYFNQPFYPNEFGLVNDIELDKPASKIFLSEGLMGVEEDEVIKFEKRGRTNATERRDLDKEKEGKHRVQFNSLDELFNRK